MSSRVFSIDEAEQRWFRLACILEELGVDGSLLDSLRDFVNPPPALNSFDRIAANLELILPIFRTFLEQERLTQHFPESHRWSGVCAVIIKNAELIGRTINDFYTQPATLAPPIQPPYHGYYESHCLGVALWCTSPTMELSDRYQVLQSVLCFAYHLARIRGHRDHLKLESQLPAACLAVRKLARIEHTHVLQTLPESPSSLREYQLMLSENASDPGHVLYAVHHLLDIALHTVSVVKRPTGIVVRRKDSTESYTDSYDIDADQGGPLAGATIVRTATSHGGRPERMKRQQALLCDDEFTDVRELIQVQHAGPDPSGGFSFSQLFVRSRYATNHIAMANQRLHFSTEMLSRHDVDIFLAELHALSKTAGEIGGIDNEELAAYLAIAFWTARTDCEVAATTRIQAPSAATAAISIYVDDDVPYIVLLPGVAAVKRTLDTQAESQALNRAQRFCLAMPLAACQVITRWATNIVIKFDERRLFVHPPADYLLAVSEFFSMVRGRHDTRLTYNRISSHLHHVLSRLPGSDLPLAMAVSGRTDVLGKVHQHYSARTTASVHDAYRRAASLITSDTVSSMSSNTITSSSQQSIVVGSRFVPRREEIAAFVCRMRERLHDLRVALNSSFEALVNFHNVLTSYSVIMTGFCTGYRAVRDPLLTEAEIDRHTGFAVLCDKDGNDFYHSRIVWLPPICLEQLDQYKKHLEGVWKALFIWNQRLFYASREDAATGGVAERACPGLFYLNRLHERVDVRPASLETYFKQADFLLPVNANRHYLRTNLVANGCPLEVVNAFLGHWETGLEPWGKMSGLSPITYRKEVENYLMNIITEDGWRVETGCT